MALRAFHIVTGAACAAGLLLAGCGHKHDDTDTDTASITIANGGADGNAQSMAISVPGFSAKLAIPGLNLNTGNTEIDGIKFHPGTQITGVNVTGKAGDGTGGESHGTVSMGFTDPAGPDALLAYYRRAAKAAGWTEVPPAAGQQFAATKPQDKGSEQLGIQIGAQGTGSTGHFLVTGG